MPVDIENQIYLYAHIFLIFLLDPHASAIPLCKLNAAASILRQRASVLQGLLTEQPNTTTAGI